MRYGVFWLTAIGVIALVVTLLTSTPRSISREFGRSRSPSGRVDAVLVEVGTESGEIRGYRVCMAPPQTLFRPAYCNEVAWLAGVIGYSPQAPVRLVWVAPAELEIRYRSARAVHVYKPVFSFGTGRYGGAVAGSNLPSLVKAVQTDETGRGPPAGRMDESPSLGTHQPR